MAYISRYLFDSTGSSEVSLLRQAHPDSAAALNLKACNHLRLYNGRAAEGELKSLTENGFNLESNDLIRHNLVVFSDGENALQVLPDTIDIIPEARLNLVSDKELPI